MEKPGDKRVLCFLLPPRLRRQEKTQYRSRGFARNLFVPLSFCLRDLISAPRISCTFGPRGARGLLQSAIPLQSFCLRMRFLRRRRPGALSNKVPFANFYLKSTWHTIPHQHTLCKRFLRFPHFSAKSSPVRAGRGCFFSIIHKNFTILPAPPALTGPAGSPRRPRTARASPRISPAFRPLPSGRP